MYSALTALTGDPDAQLVESCKNDFQTQIAIARYLLGKNNYLPAFNAYKSALQIDKTSTHCLVRVVFKKILLKYFNIVPLGVYIG